MKLRRTPKAPIAPAVRKLRRRRRLKRVSTWAWRGAMLFMVAGVLSYVFREALFGRHIAKYAEQEAVRFGLILDVGEAQGTFVSDLSLVGLQARSSSDDGPVRLALVDEVNVAYSAPHILLGKEGWLRDIRVRGLELDLNLSALLNPTAAQEGSGTPHPSLLPLPRLPHIQLLDARLTLRRGDAQVELFGVQGEVHYYPPARTAFRLDCDRVSLGSERGRFELGGLQLSGHLDGTVLVLGTASVDGHNLVRSFRMDLAQPDSDLDLEAGFGGGVLRVRELTRPGAETGELSLEAEHFSLAYFSLLYRSEFRPTGEFSAKADLTYPAGRMTEGTGHAHLELLRPAIADFQADRLLIEGSFQARNLSVQTLDLVQGANRVTGTAEVSWGDHPQAAWKLDLDLPQPTGLWTRVGFLRSLQGAVDGSWESGTVGLSVRQGHLAFTGRVPPVEDVSADLSVTGQELVLHGLSAQIGRGPVRVSGHARLPETAAGDDGWAQCDLDVSVQGQDLLLARSPDLQVRSDLDLKITDKMRAPLLSGRMQLTSVRYTKDVSLRSQGGLRQSSFVPFSLTDPPFSDARFNLSIRADRSIHVQNNLARAQASAALTLAGTGFLPVLTGNIQFEPGGMILLPFSTLTLDQGRVDLLPEDPYHPRIFAGLSAELMGYSVDAMVQGPVQDPEMVLSSSPPLPHEDLVVLITTGSTPSGIGEKGVGQFALLRLGQFYGGQLLTRYFSGAVAEEGGAMLGKIQLYTGERVSRTGEQTIKGVMNLYKGVDLIGERDEYGDYNLGVRYTIQVD